MGFSVSIVSDFTATAILRRRSDGHIWNVSGASGNSYTSSPTYANAKNAGTPATGVATGLRTFAFSHANIVDGWHDVLIADDGQGGVLTDVLELYIKNGDQVVAPAPIYHAAIEFTVDTANTRDEYTVTWFRDGERITSGVTSPSIQVVLRSTGGDLLNSSMNQVGTMGSYKHDESTNRVGKGEAAVVVVFAVIDGLSRSFADVVGRDD